MDGNRISTLAAGAAAIALLAGCATDGKQGWHRSRAAPATAVQLASCEAATSTLKDRPDHGVAYRACVDAKVRQQVD